METDNFVVKVTGNQNVPKYQFWLKSDEKDKYNVQLSSLYEREGDTKTGNIALSSLSWEFTTPSESDGVVTFDIASGPIDNRFSSLTFRNYLSKEGNDTFPKNGVKFDVIIRDYEWSSSSSDANLVLEFTFQGGDNGYFESSDNALVYYNETTSESISVGFEGSKNRKVITYDHFPSGWTLEQDPIMGVSAGISTLSVISPLISLLVALFVLFM